MGADMTYRVSWDIDIDDATSPMDAARKAHELVRRPGTSANVYNVEAPDGVVTVVDLQAGGLRIAKSSPALLHTLDRAERFISGFEGDDREEGVDQLLTDIRAALQGRMRNGKKKGPNKTSRMRARPVKGRRCR
jgi:hypothetical protein